MNKPIIGISGSLIIDQGGMFPGYKRSYVNNDYIEGVIKNGGIPFIIPFSTDKEVIKAQVEQIDALILSGGHDVDPHNYGEELDGQIGEIFPDRDFFDFELIKNAKKRNLPILGICRGAQIMNVYEGGSLYQDLACMPSKVGKHMQGHNPDLPTHYIDIDQDSLLYEICQCESLMVNSFHHQTLKNIGQGFKVTAKARDGVVECIENPAYPFMVGVQWHPEMTFRVSPEMSAIFQKIIEVSRKL